MSTSLLAELLSKLFSREELEAFLQATSRTATIVPGLPGREASLCMFTRSAAEALGRRGFIDRELFEAMLEVRSGQVEEIGNIRAMLIRGPEKELLTVTREVSAPFVLITSRAHDRDTRFSFTPDTTISELVRRIRDTWKLPSRELTPGVVTVYSYALVNADGNRLADAARVCDVALQGDNLLLLTEIEQKATAPVHAGKLNIFSLLRDDPREGEADEGG